MELQPKNGACVIITEPERRQFYIQQKCKHYPILEYRLQHSFFGGAIEPVDKTPHGALERELGEELGEARKVILANVRELFTININSEYGYYKLTFYEAVIPGAEFLKFAKLKPKEGKGKIVSRQEIEQLGFIFSLDQALAKYFETLDLNS